MVVMMMVVVGVRRLLLGLKQMLGHLRVHVRSRWCVLVVRMRVEMLLLEGRRLLGMIMIVGEETVVVVGMHLMELMLLKEGVIGERLLLLRLRAAAATV